jgi:hypothetical protein
MISGSGPITIRPPVVHAETLLMVDGLWISTRNLNLPESRLMAVRKILEEQPHAQ